MNEENKVQNDASSSAGPSVVTPGSSPQTDSAPQAPVSAPKQPGAKSGKKKGIAALAVALIVAALGYGLWMVTKDDKVVVVVKKDVPVLKYGVLSDALNLELPYESADEDTLQLYRQTHEGLVAWSEETNLVPALAKSWTSPNDTTWEFVLDSGRTFHTGKAVTPEAVKASIEAFINLDPELPGVQTISSVTAEGTDKVKIVTKAPDATLLNRLASLPIFDTTYEKGQSWNSGSGAYKLKEASEVTENSLTLTADDSYHLGRPYVREVQVTNLNAEEDLPALLKDGSIDVSTDGPVDEATAKSYTAYSFVTKKGSGAYSLRLNTIKSGGVFSNKTVRQAVALGIDTAKIREADKSLTGASANQLVPETIPGYNPAIKDVTPDVAKAKQLLADAGYTNKVVTVGYFAGRQDAAMLEVIRQLKELGFNVQAATKDSGADFITAINDGAYDMISTTSLSNINDLSDVAADVGGKNSYTPMYYNAEIDTKLAAANAIFDASKRLVELQGISKFIVEDYGFIPIRYTLYPLYVKSNLETGKNDIPTISFGAYFYKVYGK